MEVVGVTWWSHELIYPSLYDLDYSLVEYYTLPLASFK